MKIKKVDIHFETNRSGEPKKGNIKMYIWPQGETIIENLQNRRNRPYNVYKKEVIPLVMEKIKTKNLDLYNILKSGKWSWNQHCGCSMCPCSPGFISSEYGHYNIHVDITD